MKRVWQLAVAVVVAVGALLFVFQGSQEARLSDFGGQSSFTRHQLRDNWKRARNYPLLVPIQSPEKDGRPGFILTNVVTDAEVPPEARSWVSYYESSAFGVADQSFRVFQRHLDDPVTRCGPMGEVPYVERIAGQSRVTICSFLLAPGSDARMYWEQVVLTTDLDRVHWLAG